MKNSTIIRKLDSISRQLRLEMDNLDEIVGTIEELSAMIEDSQEEDLQELE